MKWFKHDSDSSTDAKLQRVQLKYGMEGYGLYFYCLELIARNVEKHNLTFELEHDVQLIANATRINEELVAEMMTFMVNLQLFEIDGGTITCLRMATRTDEYTQKLIKSSANVPTLSRQTPDAIPIISDLREEKRREENNSAFVIFWKGYPKKKNKKKAMKAFNNLTKKNQSLAIKDSETRFKETEYRYIPLATTYIHGENWNDEEQQGKEPSWEDNW